MQVLPKWHSVEPYALGCPPTTIYLECHMTTQLTGTYQVRQVCEIDYSLTIYPMNVANGIWLR